MKLFVAALCVGLLGCGPDDHGASAVDHWYSKQEMTHELLHKTKAEVRDDWGSPDQVHDDTGTWVYIRLPVRDQDAGTPAFMTTITFAGGRAESVAYD